jgi:glutathione S-transferase
VLLDGDTLIWDSLSIHEYLAERFPDAGVWPTDRTIRAAARSVSAEMHSSFAALRREMPMDCRSRHTVKPSAETRAELDRVLGLWRDCRARAEGGDFLFGRFCAADAMYAPVATRFMTYGVELDPVCSAYRDSLLHLPPMREWLAAAEAEAEVIE